MFIACEPRQFLLETKTLTFEVNRANTIEAKQGLCAGIAVLRFERVSAQVPLRAFESNVKPFVRLFPVGI